MGSLSPIYFALVPALAGAATGAVLFGPGQPRAVEGVILHASTARGAAATAFVVEAKAFAHDRFDPLPEHPLTVELRDASGTASWSGQTDDEGRAAVHLNASPGFSGDLQLTVRSAATGTLLTAPLPPVAPRPVALPRDSSSVPRVEVLVLRRNLVPEYPAELELRIVTEEDALPRAITVDARGGTVTPLALRETDDAARRPHVARYRTTVVPRSIAFDLEIEVDGASHSVALPLRPGGLWLSPTHDTVKSSSPKRTIWAAAVNRFGRTTVQSVAMRTTPDGYAEGQLPLRADARSAIALSTDPHFTPASTTVWPLAPHGPIFEIPAVELATDFGRAASAEARRARRARLPALFAIGIAGLYTLVLLVHLNRRSRRRLAEHLQTANGIDSSAARALDRSPSPGRALVVGAALVLAFTGLALVAAFVQFQ